MRSASFLLVLLCGATQSRGYEADTTLAGLTQQAALAARLHRHLVDRFGCSLGLFEPLRLHMDQLPEVASRDLRGRLLRLLSSEGEAPEQVAPGPQSFRILQQSALGWLSAGTVIESIPTWRECNHFLDPRTGAGLTRPQGQSRSSVALRAVNNGLSDVRELLTGAAFDGSGMASTEWLAAPANDLGLFAFHRAHVQAVLAPSKEARETALVQALLAAGGILNLLEQAGDPAYVRNDFQGALLDNGGRYQRWVALRYGRAGVPPPVPETEGMMPVQRLVDLFVDSTGGKSGLAERTALTTCSGASQCAGVLLPEIGRYAQRALDFLFRGEMKLALSSDEPRTLQITSPGESLGQGTLTLLGETSEGKRRSLLQVKSQAKGTQSLQVPETAGLVRLVVLFEGEDAASQPLVLSAQIPLS